MDGEKEDNPIAAAAVEAITDGSKHGGDAVVMVAPVVAALFQFKDRVEEILSSDR